MLTIYDFGAQTIGYFLPVVVGDAVGRLWIPFQECDAIQTTYPCPVLGVENGVLWVALEGRIVGIKKGPAWDYDLRATEGDDG